MFCKIRFVFMIVLLFTTNGSSFPTFKKSGSHCKLPYEYELDSLYIQASIIFIQKRNQFLEANNLTDGKIEKHFKISNQSFQIDNKMCDKKRYDQLNVNTRSDCPYTYEHVHRPDRYPFDIISVKCGCERCNSFGPSKRCLPLYTQRPVLIGECNEDGFYEFTPDI